MILFFRVVGDDRPAGSSSSDSSSSSSTSSDSGTGLPTSTTSPPSSSSSSSSSSSASSSTSSPSSSSPSSSPSSSSSSTAPIISFPSGNTTSVTQTISSFSTVTTTSSSSTFTPPPNSQLSYITQTTLLGASVPSTTASPTNSDPDAAATTLSIAPPSSVPTAPAPQAALPSDLPARVYPPNTLDTSDLSGYTLVSVLFDQFLPWQFVAEETQSQGQLFLWFPVIVQTALNLTTDQVKTFALQVYVPAAYTGPQDRAMLLTTYLLYIPTADVATLANQIKVASSPFYDALGDPYKSLAGHVNPAFALNAVQDPNDVPGTPGGADAAAAKHSSNARTDAIIGVVSALGGLTLLILAVLVVRSVRRARALRHHRLSDPAGAGAEPAPYGDRAGRDFDQDSVGGQRRRSFYFAEDSLRGGQPQPPQPPQIYRQSPEHVRERRPPVVPGAISAPILTQSSLNW
ncbi:hypothetical protein BC834DRAFT_824777 [Gloeopeniophorella convolvens]|nr:hypothetical protein BC834DRAFT_824777 [Gloeopeniophorella convolvens]